MEMRLDGRTALVTGSGRGIGRAIAIGLADAGVSVALLARSREELLETAEVVSARGPDPLVVPVDLGDLAELTRAVERASRRLGTIDILVNNAAVVWPLGPSVAVDAGSLSAAIAVNVVAVAAVTFALLPAMLDRWWGRVVNVSSGIAAYPAAMVGGNAYATSKAALEAHTLNLAAELAGTGVTVNAFRPGAVDTAMQRFIRSQDPAKIGVELHERFVRAHADGTLIAPQDASQSLLARLQGDATGEIWDVADTT
jgi:3-oxoacyl-[acyl-carrier protein] reductase